MTADRGLALFDLDGTLLPIDSDHAWGEFMVALGWVDAAGFRSGNDAFYAQYQAGRLDTFSLATKRAITVPLLKQMLAEEADE